MSLKTVLASLAWRAAPRLMIEQHLWRRKSQLEPELWIAPRLVRRGETAIDVGANRGVWAIQLAKAAGRVEAFECNPICQADVRAVIDRRITLHPVALSDRAGSVQMRFDPGNTGIGTIEQKNDLSQNDSIKTIQTLTVPTRPLDDFDFTGVGLIKIDVEGHEEAVLRGAAQTLARDHPALIIEIEDRHNFGALGRIEASLQALGYDAFVLRHGVVRTIGQARADGARLGQADDINNFIFVDPARANRLGFAPGVTISR